MEETVNKDVQIQPIAGEMLDKPATSADCDRAVMTEQHAEGAVQEQEKTKPVTVPEEMQKDPPSSADCDQSVVTEQDTEGAVPEQEEKIQPETAPEEMLKDPPSTADCDQPVLTEQHAEGPEQEKIQPVTVPDEMLKDPSSTADCDQPVLTEQHAEGPEQEKIQPVTVPDEMLKDSPSTADCDQPVLTEQHAEGPEQEKIQPVTVPDEMLKDPPSTADCDQPVLTEQHAEGPEQEKIQPVTVPDEMLKDPPSTADCDQPVLTEQHAEGPEQEKIQPVTVPDEMLKDPSSTADCDQPLLMEQHTEGAIPDQEVKIQLVTASEEMQKDPPSSADCDLLVMAETPTEAAVAEQEIRTQPAAEEMQKEPSTSTECDPPIKEEQCIEDLVPEQDSDNVDLGVESNGDDNVAAATEGAVSGQGGPDNAGLHTGSNDDDCVATTDDAVPEQKDSDFVDQCMDSNNCDDHVAATGNDVDLQSGVSVDGAVLEPPGKKQKLEMGEQSRNAKEESWETLYNVEVPEVEGSKVDGVHSASSSVEQCDQKGSAEQEKDSDDSMGMNALFIRGAEPVTVDYPDIAGRPSSSAGAEAQPPRSAPNDQCSVQAPVLFGGPQSHFSNFYPCHIHVFDRDFHSSEQAYQYQQAMFHGDSETAEWILRADDARAAKRESKHINKTKDGWEDKRVDVMREILKAKADVPEFRDALLATGQAVLVENVPSLEGFWGLGNGCLGGKNILGRLLMELRDHLITGRSEVETGRVMYEEGRQQGNWVQRKSQNGRQHGNRRGINRHDQYGDQQPVLFQGPKSWFSTFYRCRIHVFDRDFHSSEQAYQYQQAMFHDDSETAKQIMRTGDARAAMKESKNINETKHGWEVKRVDVMREILKAKAEVPEFREALLATGKAVMVYDMPTQEGFWGVGDRHVGGENVLGRLLMELRDSLRSGWSEVQTGPVKYEEGRQEDNWGQGKSQGGNWEEGKSQRSSWGQEKSQRGSWGQGKSQRGSREQGKSLNRRQHGMIENRRYDKLRTDHPRENIEKLDGRGQVESRQWASREQGQSHSGRQQGNGQRMSENRSKGHITDYPRDDDENLIGRRQYHREERRDDDRCLGTKGRSTKRGQPSHREDSEHSQTREHAKVTACDEDHRSTEATADPPGHAVCSINDYPQDQSQAGRFYKKDELEDEGWKKVSKKKKGKKSRK